MWSVTEASYIYKLLPYLWCIYNTQAIWQESVSFSSGTWCDEFDLVRHAFYFCQDFELLQIVNVLSQPLIESTWRKKKWNKRREYSRCLCVISDRMTYILWFNMHEKCVSNTTERRSVHDFVYTILTILNMIQNFKTLIDIVPCRD